MPQYKIHWNAGYGENWDYVDAKDQDEADKIAYEAWRDDAENNSEYWAELADPENDEDHPDHKDDE